MTYVNSGMNLGRPSLPGPICIASIDQVYHSNGSGGPGVRVSPGGPRLTESSTTFELCVSLYRR